MKTLTTLVALPLAAALLCGAPSLAARASTAPRAVAFEDDLAAAVKHLSSRFRRERERALDVIVAAGKDALATLTALLDSEDAGLRRLAATGLERLKRPEARSALLVRLAKETDGRLVDHLVDSLVVYGADAWVVIKARGKSATASETDRRAHERFLWRYSVQVVHRILKENTDASGNFKGFYDGQFEDLVEIGPETGRVLLAIMNDNERFPLSLQQIAVRAMSEVGGRESLEALRAFHKRMENEFGIDDPLRHQEPRRVLKTYARYVLARLGDTDASMEQITYLRHRMRSERRWRRIGHAALYQWELAYEYHQVRNFAKAKEEYHRYLNDFPEEQLTVGNSRHVAYYNLCCICSLQAGASDGVLEAQGLDRKKLEAQALRYLAKAFDENYTDFYWLTVDRDLDAIRKLPEFQALIDKQRAKFIPKFGDVSTPESSALLGEVAELRRQLEDLDRRIKKWNDLPDPKSQSVLDQWRAERAQTQNALAEARAKLAKLGKASKPPEPAEPNAGERKNKE